MKRAQGAMEFLMTYGWAVLVVMLAVAAMAFYGLFNMDNYQKRNCRLPAGMACVDYSVKPLTATVVVDNSLGKHIKSVSATLTDCTIDSVTVNGKDILITKDVWPNHDRAIFQFTCSGPQTGTRYFGDFIISYTSSEEISHNAKGEISVIVD